MHLATVAFLFGGSLLVSASSAASDLPRLQLGSSSVSRASSIPEAIASQNIRDAAPAAAQFAPQNGYTGDLTLLAPMRGRAKPQPVPPKSPSEIVPLANGPEQLLRFDQQLPQGGVASPLLETSGRARSQPVIYFVPSAGEK